MFDSNHDLIIVERAKRSVQRYSAKSNRRDNLAKGFLSFAHRNSVPAVQLVLAVYVDEQYFVVLVFDECQNQMIV